MRPLFRPKTHCAFTLTEVVVVAVIFGMLAAILHPIVIRARDSARLNTIQANLCKLEEAKETWTCDHRKGEGAPVGSAPVLADYQRGGAVQ